MVKHLLSSLLALWLVCAGGLMGYGLAEAETQQPDQAQQAELQLTAAMIANVAYNGELKSLTRNWLMSRGWRIKAYQPKREENGRLYIFSHTFQDRDIVFMTFPGTETLQDAKLDLQVTRVPFGGSTPAEFAQQAANLAGKSGDKPLVHQGFNDYVQQLLFTRMVAGGEGLTMGEIAAQELREDPELKIYLTGHSLGGAVATLAAARLADLGVRPEQLEVITFGAPAVGNEAFARAYEHKFSLTRVVMAGDPVKSVLQSLTGGFVQFGRRVDWKSRLTERFPHEMVLYLDEAWRHYADATPKGERPKLAGEAQLHLKQSLYVAKPIFKLSRDLRGELPYMESLVKELTAGEYVPEHQAVAIQSFPDVLAKAKAAGCGYILSQQYTGKRIRQEKDNYRITLEETIYDHDGNVCYMQSRSTTTREMTPVQAAAYLHVRGEADRAQVLNAGEEYAQQQEFAIVNMNTEHNKNSEK